jgi:cation diffusion facilitator family transporter
MDHRRHDHSFGQELKRPGEEKTIIVIGATAMMMVIEIVGGVMFGSMVLLADGLHMASHTAALTISAFAYIYARRHAHDERYSFGTGKVISLGGYTGGLLLAMFALMMGWESVVRFIHPVEVGFDQAIAVAVLGLVVNVASLLVLGHEHHEDQPDHDHYERDSCVADQRANGHQHDHHHDHNLRAAYLHVVADALTSVLAIAALIAGKYGGLIWLDPLTGILGAIVVARWSIGLLHTTSKVLLNRQGPASIRETIRRSIESEAGNRVTDLHLWSIGPGIYAVELVIVARIPRSADHYRELLPTGMGLEHISIEVNETVVDHLPSQLEQSGRP